MDLTEYIRDYLNGLDFSDEESLREAYFRAASTYNVHRLFFFRPDMVAIIKQKEVVEMIEGRKGTGDTDIVDYFQWILDLFAEVGEMNKEEMQRGLCESYIKLNVAGVLFEELEQRGAKAIPSLLSEVEKETFLQRITFYEVFKDSEMQELCDEFPVEITAFDKNEFVDYGDEEVLFSDDELDEIIADIKVEHPAIPSDVSHSNDTPIEEEPDLRTQDQRIDDYMNDMARHVENTKARHTARGHFPFDFRIHRVQWYIDDESLGMDDEHLAKFYQRIMRLKVPGYAFTAKYKKSDLGLNIDIDIHGFIDATKS